MAENVPPTTSNQSIQPAAPAPKRKRRRWPWVIVAILVLLVLLVLFAPMIASTAPVRSFVVGKINENVNGKVDIHDWSIGWTGGIVVNGIRVLDDKGVQILQVEKFSTQLSLIDAMRKKIDLGKTSLDGVDFNLTIDKDGHSNFERLAKASTKPSTEKERGPHEKGPGGPLPDVSVDFTANVRGTIQQEGQPTVHLDPSTISAKIPNINDPITEDVDLALRVGDGAPGKVKLSGTVDAIDANQVNVDKLSADQNVTIATIDLAALTPFLKIAGAPVELRGVSDGSLKVKLGGTSDADVSGEIKVAKFEASGDVFKGGDKFVSIAVNIPVNITRKVQGSTTQIVIKNTAVKLDQGNITISADATQESLASAGRLLPAAIARAMGKPVDANAQPIAIAQSGKVDLTADLDVANIANQLKHTISIPEDRTIDKGRLTHATHIELANNSAVISTTTDLPDLQGTSQGKKVALSPIHAEAGVSAVGGATPDLRDVKIDARSGDDAHPGFFRVKGGGPTLAKINLGGDIDLAKMQAEASQFVDLDELVNGKPGADAQAAAREPLKLAGVGTFSLTTDGDLTKPDSTIATGAKLDLSDVDIRGLKSLAAPIHEPMVSLAYSGTAQRGTDEKHFITGVKDATVSLTTGKKDAPTVQLAASADLTMAGKVTAPRFELTKLDVDLPRAQDELAPMLAPASAAPVNPYVDKSAPLPGAPPTSQPSVMTQLAQRLLSITSGRLTGSAAGSYDGATLTFSKPLVLSMQKVTLEKTQDGQKTRVLDGETFDVNLAGTASIADGKSAKLSQLTVTSSSNIVRVEKSPDKDLVISLSPDGAPGGSGSLHVNSDLARAKQVADAFSGSTAKPDPATALHSGKLDGTLAFNRAANQPQTSIDANLALTELTVGDKLKGERLDVVTNATVPDAFDTAQAKLDVKSAFATVSVPDAQLMLKRGKGDESKVGVWEMIRNASAKIDVPDLPKLYALAGAFSAPPPTPPAGAAPSPPPMDVASGALSMSMTIARDDAKKATNINLTDLHASKLALRRGERQFAFPRDVALKLAAMIGATTDIQTIQISQLDGDLGVSKLSMPQPIAITNLVGGGTPNANGTIELGGSLKDVTPLLAVLGGGNELPYTGDFAIKQALTTQGDTIALVGDVTTKQFTVLDSTDRSKTVFTEPEVAIKNNVTVDTKKQIATINALSVDMPQTQALGVKVTGGVEDWAVQRKVNNVKIDLTYDLPKLWPIVHPMLIKPGEEDQFKDMKIAGKYTKTFVVSGNYPASSADGKPLPWNESVRSLYAAGELAVDLLDTSGVTLEQLALPITMIKGQVITNYADGHKPTPAKFNGGTLDLGNILLDVTQPVARIAVVDKDKKLVQKASINSLLGDTLGKYVNPVFTNSERAKGLLDVTANYVEAVAADSATIKSEQSGRAKITFSLTDMDIANPLGTMIAGGAINKMSSALNMGGVSNNEADVFQGQIKDAVVTLENGRTTQDITMQLVDPSTVKITPDGKKIEAKPMLMSFKGDIRLSDLTQSLNVVFPSQLIAKFIPDHDIQKGFIDAFPSGVPLSLKGTTSKPVIDYGNIIGKFAQGFVQGKLLNSAIGGGKKSDAAEGGDGGGGAVGGGAGGLGGLLEQALSGDKDKDSDKDKDKDKEGKDKDKNDKKKQQSKKKQEAPESATTKKSKQDAPNTATTKKSKPGQ